MTLPKAEFFCYLPCRRHRIQDQTTLSVSEFVKCCQVHGPCKLHLTFAKGGVGRGANNTQQLRRGPTLAECQNSVLSSRVRQQLINTGNSSPKTSSTSVSEGSITHVHVSTHVHIS